MVSWNLNRLLLLNTSHDRTIGIKANDPPSIQAPAPPLVKRGTALRYAVAPGYFAKLEAVGQQIRLSNHQSAQGWFRSSKKRSKF